MQATADMNMRQVNYLVDKQREIEMQINQQIVKWKITQLILSLENVVDDLHRYLCRKMI